MRHDGRAQDELRPLKIIPHANPHALGSVEISMGQTRILCTAGVSESTPGWLNRPGHGWLTAEYAMLPHAGDVRMNRERGFSGGRAQEISRLIGRALRSAVDLSKLGERQIHIDCDVLTADGGTRTTAITGGWVALALALKNLQHRFVIKQIPLKNCVCAVSLGLKNGEILTDLDFREDKSCDTDINFVINDKGGFVEIQGTAEKSSFTKEQMSDMTERALKASKFLIKKQRELAGGEGLFSINP